MPLARNRNFMRAIILFLRLPNSLKTRRTASVVGSNSSSGQEIGQERRFGGQAAESATDQHPEPALLDAIYIANLRDEADVVNAGDGAIAVVLASGKSDLEFARQIIEIGMPQQEAGNAQGIGRNVESFRGADAGNGAGGDVAHGIEAGFARGQAGLGEYAHGLRHVCELHEMELHVLARGQVAAAGRVVIRNFGEGEQLLGREKSRDDLDAQHLDAGLALAVGAVRQAEAAPFVFRKASGLKLADGFLEGHDLRSRASGVCLASTSGKAATVIFLSQIKKAATRFASGERPLSGELLG